MMPWQENPRLQATLLFVLTVVCYLPGLDSLFLFDDLPNLAALSQINGIGLTTPGFWEFVLSGNAGPTGRPVSLFTFALQAAAWPDNPVAFKLVNVLLHACSAILIYTLFYRLAVILKTATHQAAPIALVTALAWALHPVHTSTVLYTVQRMALLSNFFMLLGLMVFVECRIRQYTERPVQLAGLALVLGGIGLLGLLSKENAASLVLYLLVLDYTLLRALPTNTTYRYWRLACLWLPAVILLVSPVVFFDYLQASFAENRSFTQGERLLTQGRVMWQYLGVLLLPSISGVGIFHDIDVSRSLLDPVTTLLALIAWTALLALAIRFPGRQRLWLFALTWYFAGHAIESTVLPLEIFFHHRGYLAIAGLVFALVYIFFTRLPAHLFRGKARPVIAGIYLILLALSTARISLLWSTPLQLSERWYEADPDTGRNVEFYAMQLTQYGPQGEQLAAAVLDRAARANPANFHLVLNLLTLACVNPQVMPPDENRLLAQAADLSADNRDPVSPMQQIINLHLQDSCPAYDRAFLGSLLETMISGTSGHDKGMFQFELARLRQADADHTAALQLMDQAWNNSRDTGILFNQAIQLVNLGRYEEALAKISLAENTVQENNNIRTGTRTAKLATLGSMREDVLGFMNNER